MGQPPLWEPFLMPAALMNNRHERFGSVTLGLHKPLTNPIIGLLGASAEAYATTAHKRDVKPGGRLLATSPVLGLSAGIDWDGRNGGVDGIFSFQTAIRRSGILGHGTLVRLDWLPGRAQTVSAGVRIPFGQPFAGRTRPVDTDVDEPVGARRQLLDGALSPDIQGALDRVSRSAAMILAYTNLFAKNTASVQYGESFRAAMRDYMTGLAHAFRLAAGDSALGERIALRARTGALDAVILPYDSLFGQVKQHDRTIRPLTATAHEGFARWLRDSSGVTPSLSPAVIGVHAHWLGILEAVHGNLLAQWNDSRLVWLPMQLALTEDQYDSQIEVDSLIERAVGRPFTDQNALAYLRSSDIPLEIARSIFAARDYHVLWTHDFAGRRNDTKSLDEISFAMVADAYLPALTQAVQRYDTARVFPMYMILIDAFYYASRNGRLWMSILEDPLRARIRLPGNNPEQEAHLRRRQQELRDAVANSWRFQMDATANGGERWLPEVVKVHVNVLLPHDFSFRSHRIVPPWPFVPDNIMRDHRKIVLYDVTEADPYAGAVMVMGVGIGEHYASDTWEDRGYRIRGPAALEARAAARRALMGNGIAESDLPPPLAERPRPKPNGATREYAGRALQLHNEAGFGAKESSVARAMLYNLAPPGSVIIVPDPLWISDTWAAMLAGAAARGCRVFVIAPSSVNNPNPHAPIEAAEHDVMLRLMEVRDRLKDEMARAGGELRVALFSARAPVTDQAGRIAEVRAGLERYPWLRELIPFDDQALAVLDRAVVSTEADGRDATAIAKDETPRAPKLHQKTQLIARPGAIAALVRQPGWEQMLATAMQTQSRQTAKFADEFGFTTPDVDSAALQFTDALIRGYEQRLSDADRRAVSFYFSLGTQNQDPRGIVLDGEATVLVSGYNAALGLVDLYYLMARSTWLDSKSDLDRLLPRPRGLLARLVGLIRGAL